MAQYFIHPAQNKDLLAAGQTIQVGDCTVKVERHLSQGGFAHVYLVRTDQPVLGTTQHVLKHIRVAQEIMLKEVQKEVDVMRLLRGHPNVVHLIDAAWSKHPNGTFEVFILMEFCPGGGIIDMMNRRLRERLTEAEILQIFVDVCEGVACMHNQSPALIHRDLKVENILQASATKYKLCDFGSACFVAPRPPSTLQEIQALGADLDRHTTLQYRAPEMIDLNLRRPIDEKSDVWALGVLLYKLCYYTTPFEEHGPLAILNVQYTTPPYPVYSLQMNQLIASMLRDYGTHRPSVFDLLTMVHAMRGTRSQFAYNRVTAPSLTAQPPTSSLDGILVRNKDQARPSAAAARKQVLDAIAPMRRGRPESSSTDDRAWEAAKAKDLGGLDAWDVQLKRVEAARSPPVPVSSPGAPGFGDSFKPTIRTAHTPSQLPPVQPPVFTQVSSPSPAPVRTPAISQTSAQSSYPNVLRAPSAPIHVQRTPVHQVPTPSLDMSLSAEERFPSLDELDRAFSGNANYASPAFQGTTVPALPPRPDALGVSQVPLRGARSQQVTGVAMKETVKTEDKPTPAPLTVLEPTRPSLRRHRSSVAIKSPVLSSPRIPTLQSKPPAQVKPPPDWLTGDGPSELEAPKVSQPSHDWLTGDNDFSPHAPSQIARTSLNGPRAMGPRPLPATPSKIQNLSPKPPLPPRQRADSPEPIKEETPSAILRAAAAGSAFRHGAGSAFRTDTGSAFKSETASVFRQPIPPSSSSAFRRNAEPDSFLASRPLPSSIDTSPSGQTGLTENWSPVEHSRADQSKSSSSSSDEDKSPEDVAPSARRSVLEPKARKSKIRPKGRNSSVHDLVDLWSTPGESSPAGGKVGALVQESHIFATQQHERPPSVQAQRPPSRLDRPPSVQGYGYGQKRSPGPSPVLRPTPIQPVKAPPSPSRTRPQSMFLYGAGSSLSPPGQVSQQPAVYTALQHQTPTAGLSAPQDAAKVRASRRGSITDMVEKYEALASPRSPTGPRWSPVAPGNIALPGLTAPALGPASQTSTGLSTSQQRRVSTGRISPASSTASSSASSANAFTRWQPPARKSTAPAASPTKPTWARPPSPAKASVDFGGARSGTPMSGAGTPKPLVASNTPKPGATTTTPKPNVTGSGGGVRAAATGNRGGGYMKSSTTGNVGAPAPAKPLATGFNVKPLATGGFVAGVKPITTGTGLGLKSATPVHTRNSSTSVLLGARTGTPVPPSPVTVLTPVPVPVKPVSLSRRPVGAPLPPLKSITPPRDLNGGSAQTQTQAQTQAQTLGQPSADPHQAIASPTPDRPYGGVSKLIDQWQRKTEEAGQPVVRKLKG